MKADHLVRLGASEWSVWRHAILRGSGFEASGVTRLGSESLGEALETLFSAESELEAARRQALATCSELASQDDQDAQTAEQVAEHLEAGRALKRDTGIESLDVSLRAIRSLGASIQGCQQELASALEEHKRQALAVLKDYAESPLFREAITWQNRNALETAIDGFLRAPSSSNAKARERHRLMAKYIQRYTVKNDSIGFFGPVAWVEMNEGERDFEWTPGPLLVKRQVSYEHWAVASIASKLAEDEALHHALLPRRKPTVWLEDQALHGARAEPEMLSPSQAHLLLACDGSRRAVDIARELAGISGDEGFASEAAVYQELGEMARRALITWTIEVPPEIDTPMQWLQELMQGVEDPEAQKHALAMLDEFEALRAQLAQAAGDPVALGKSIESFEALFQERTMLDAKRGHGEVYASRQIFFEDCVRGGRLQIGSTLLDELGAPLSLILDSARWYTFHLGKRLQAAFLGEYKRLSASTPQVRLPAMLAAASAHFAKDQYSMSPVVTAVRGELQRRWEHCLDRKGATGPVQRSSAEIASRVQEAFAAPMPGWQRACYQSPDIMVCASSAEAVAKGDYLGVLGESHAGTNSLLGLFFQTQHPNRDELTAFYDADTKAPCVEMTMARANRALKVSFSSKDHHIELGGARSFQERENVHLVGDLYVEEKDGRLVVKSSTSTKVNFELINVLERYIAADVEAHFNIIAKAAYSPRVTIDKLVISRESWRFKRADFTGLLEAGTGDEAFTHVARWAHRHKMPRYVFGSVSNEPKPFYVDFCSPLLVDIFLRFLKKAKSLSLSEMLPAHGEFWLSDEEARRYSAELRFAAVDPREWRPAKG